MQHPIDPEFSGQLTSFYPVMRAQHGEGCLIHAFQDEMYYLAGSPEAEVKGEVLLGRGRRTLSSSDPSATQVHTQGEHTHAPGLWLKLVWCTLGGTSWRFGKGAEMEQGQTKSQPSFSRVTKHKTKEPGVALGDCDLTRCISQVLFICLEPT